MRVCFRVDASLVIGTGHVMRCLTLAHALAEIGATCEFICRVHPGDLIDTIRACGFKTHSLSLSGGKESQIASDDGAQPAHAAWLGVSWRDDAEQTVEAVRYLSPDWLVVDHYALDNRWEEVVVPRSCRLLAIDDLADRKHTCDVLLDQNLGRLPSDYTGLVPRGCMCLIGPQYALLRSEFALMRDASLARRATARLENVLVAMGGVDKDNATGAVLRALRECALPKDCRITIVMGGNAPWLGDVKSQAASMPWPAEVVVNVTNMAQRMCAADLALGAAGTTSWERCCMALPTLMVVVADNQWNGARALAAEGAALLLGTGEDIDDQLPQALQALRSGVTLTEMAWIASRIADGAGRERIVRTMENQSATRAE